MTHLKKWSDELHYVLLKEKVYIKYMVQYNKEKTPPVTRYYQNNYTSDIAMGRALTKNGQE